MRSAHANQLLRCVEDYASVLKEVHRKREESKAKQCGEINDDESKLKMNNTECSNASNAEKKAISPIKKTEAKRKPESFCTVKHRSQIGETHVNGAQMQAHGATVII